MSAPPNGGDAVLIIMLAKVKSLVPDSCEKFAKVRSRPRASAALRAGRPRSQAAPCTPIKGLGDSPAAILACFRLDAVALWAAGVSEGRENFAVPPRAPPFAELSAAPDERRSFGAGLCRLAVG